MQANLLFAYANGYVSGADYVAAVKRAVEAAERQSG